MFATYCTNHKKSKGRLFKEKDDPLELRTCYERDRDRILYSNYFRKLSNKAQTFLHYNGDYYRTRLTHSLEVAQITRTICKKIGLNEDLGEAIALAHDIGHPPFGHTGERALAKMTSKYDPFNHNVNALRILTKIDRSYIDFPGLNLTCETLEGIIKHNGKDCNIIKNPYVIHYNTKQDLSLNYNPSLEAQIASCADDIAYNTHDLDDGIRSNIITLEQVSELEGFGRIFKDNYSKYKKNNIENKYIALKAVKDITKHLITDLRENTLSNITKHNIKTIEDIKENKNFIAGFSEKNIQNLAKLKLFFQSQLYNNYKINRITNRAYNTVHQLFIMLFENPQCLPKNWYIRFKNLLTEKDKCYLISDFISGMTDRYAIKEYKELIENDTLKSFYNID